MPTRIPSPEPSEPASEAATDYSRRSSHITPSEPETPQAEQSQFEAPPPYNHPQRGTERQRGPLLAPPQFFQTALRNAEASGSMLPVGQTPNHLGIATLPPQDVHHPSTPPRPFVLYSNSGKEMGQGNGTQLLDPVPEFLRGRVDSPSA